ncbi:hypothetical protein [Psychromicrobium sp. YIM B11713]|uniref:hypothetical protein n=1 Tax=Psychromicrobium sp. YIM B11713 TaxID=3145233 RepID=UPI00374FC5C6
MSTDNGFGENADEIERSFREVDIDHELDLVESWTTSLSSGIEQDPVTEGFLDLVLFDRRSTKSDDS